MRFLLLIPVFVLFLFNVPFIQEMPMEEMMAMLEKQEEKDCCKKEKKEDPAQSCHQEKNAKPMACHQGAVPVENGCQPSGTNCVCVCVFQFAAAAYDLKLFQFEPGNPLAGRTGYLEQKWKDPHIASPAQPPDARGILNIEC